MLIEELESEVAEWDAFVRASEDGSPFHLTAWRRVVAETFGLRSYYLMARRGRELEGVLPLFEARSLLGERVLVSVPYGVYGGICAMSDEACDTLLKAAADLGRRRGAAYVELRHRSNKNLALPVKALYVTFTRSIEKSIEENARAIPAKQRRMTRQGVKHGLSSVIERNHLDAVYRVYAESVRNLGSPVYPRRLFQAIADAFEDDCQIVSVWHEGRVVAGVLTLFYRDQVLPYYGGALRRAFAYAVNDFMYWELMCYAALAGYRVFDFGRSREGTGAYDFKRHWGFTPAPLPYQYVLLRRQTLPDVNPSNRRLAVASRVWRRLPLAVTNRVGPIISRYLP